ncbi:MAG: hypothetical protein KDA88_06810 [Planctomycetaceae bacterium]|nr:hypothetical protein [Planctomycetaceae bacterium]MCB9953157.1 hypothetical protein [Planctomycetaceae bacterium]
MSEAKAASETSPQSGFDWRFWLVGLAALAWALSLVMAQVPADLKRLVIQYAVFGLAIGILSGLIWQWMQLGQRGKWTHLFVFAATLLGLLNTTGMSFVEYRQDGIRQAENPQFKLALTLLESEADLDPIAQAEYEELKRTGNRQLTDYLQFRVSQLGKWPVSAAVAFWLMELLLGAGVSAFVFSLMIERQSPASLPVAV